MNQRAPQCVPHPVVGGIYRDRSDQSLVVLSIEGNEALLEYADGSITAIDVTNWRRLHPQPAAF